ncbi:hypothetical protein CYLTODRAFT_417266 [Cylindrobasidium torrendii FP15055 ss-10]|uniref:Uncharacterized protein n=2 Tax=Cylindrobasidium torrendii FP15055 ss-10 TaxID=1314674 RepID=A0A0D7B9B2_9AGAR|nr:hypothetical protein CYLTODRAFT_491199 [Cylindrobasidium torrendii FP15055 ss-10]KIY73304.1 hypothetical protein CYLTODRAFT_417266 [Cylindrobasidium torrendii FP15055 ss-10]
MQFTTSFFTVLAIALGVAALPSAQPEPYAEVDITKRETSYGNPDLVVDQGDRWKLNFGSTNGHNNACPGHYICYIGKGGSRHGDQSWGNPDDFVDEGNRWRFNYGSARGNPCGDHYICYYNK